jgi:hypothetical protein
MAIYEELLVAASKGKSRFASPADDESDNDYLGRLTQAISSCTKDDFEAMSADAQSWFDAAADALNTSKEVPLPEGFDRTLAAAAAFSGNGGTPPRPRTTRPSASAADTAPAQPADPQPSDAEPSSPVRRGRPPLTEAQPGVSRRIRQLVIDDQEITIDGIIDKLKSEPAIGDLTKRRSTVATLRYDTLATLNLAKESGWVPPS